MPLLVIQGEEDAVVPPFVAARLVAHWTAVGDLVDDGLLNDSLKLVEPSTAVPSTQGRHSYTHTTITAPGDNSLVDSYLIQDMGRVWPGPAGDGLYIDHAGPDSRKVLHLPGQRRSGTNIHRRHLLGHEPMWSTTPAQVGAPKPPQVASST